VQPGESPASGRPASPAAGPRRSINSIVVSGPRAQSSPSESPNAVISHALEWHARKDGEKLISDPNEQVLTPHQGGHDIPSAINSPGQPAGGTLFRRTSNVQEPRVLPRRRHRTRVCGGPTRNSHYGDPARSGISGDRWHPKAVPGGGCVARMGRSSSTGHGVEGIRSLMAGVISARCRPARRWRLFESLTDGGGDRVLEDYGFDPHMVCNRLRLQG